MEAVLSQSRNISALRLLATQTHGTNKIFTQLTSSLCSPCLSYDRKAVTEVEEKGDNRVTGL